jgi:lipopolysaccharide assembly protein A
MRYLYIVLVAAFTLVVIVFMGQNLQNATVSFFSWSVTLPVSIIAFLCYALGMLTGGFLLSSLRSWIRGATPGSR